MARNRTSSFSQFLVLITLLREKFPLCGLFVGQDVRNFDKHTYLFGKIK